MQENNFLEDRKQHINNTKKSMFNQLYLKHCRESKLSNDVSMYYFNMNITLLHMTFDTAICGIDSIYDEFNLFVLKKLRSQGQNQGRLQYLQQIYESKNIVFAHKHLTRYALIFRS